MLQCHLRVLTCGVLSQYLDTTTGAIAEQQRQDAALADLIPADRKSSGFAQFDKDVQQKMELVA